MSILTRLPQIVNDVGLTETQIVKALAESISVREGVIAKTKEVQQYWISIAPETERKEHPVQAGGSETIAPGDYKKSIKIKYETKPILVGIVYTNAPHAHWLEYGSIHNPEYGFAQATADNFNNAEFTGRA